MHSAPYPPPSSSTRFQSTYRLCSSGLNHLKIQYWPTGIFFIVKSPSNLLIPLSYWLAPRFWVSAWIVSGCRDRVLLLHEPTIYFLIITYFHLDLNSCITFDIMAYLLNGLFLSIVYGDTFFIYAGVLNRIQPIY